MNLFDLPCHFAQGQPYLYTHFQSY